jgi:hypothetical protein
MFEKTEFLRNRIYKNEIIDKNFFRKGGRYSVVNGKCSTE